MTIRRGSWRYPSLHSRHMEESAGGSGAICLLSKDSEDVIGCALLFFGNVEPLRLQIEHGAVAAAKGHQFVMRAELDHPAVLEHADAIGMANGGEAMRDQDGGAMARGGEQAIENLRFATHVELRGRFIQQHHARAQADRRERPCERNALPLAAGKIGAAAIAAGKHGVERRPGSPLPPIRARRARSSSGAPAGATLSRSGSSSRMKSWNTAATRERHEARSNSRRSTPSISMAPDCGSYKRHNSFASVVLPAPFCPTMASDVPAGMVRSRRSRTGAPPGYPNVTSRRRISRAGMRVRRAAAGWQLALRAHGSLEPQHGRDGSGGSVQRPTESAKCDHRHANGALHVDDRVPKTDVTRDGGKGQRPEDSHVGAGDQEHAPEDRTLAQTRGCILKFVQASAPGDETVERPAGKAEQTQFLAGRRIYRQPVRIVGVTLRAAHFFGIAVAPDRALAQKPMRGQPRAREQDRRPPGVSRKAGRRRRPRRSSPPSRWR